MLLINLWEPCYFAKVPDGPQTYTLDVLWLQEEWAKVFDVNSTVSLVLCPWVQQVSHDVFADADFLFDFDIQRTLRRDIFL